MLANAPTKPKRRFLRFTLRSLLLLMLIVCVALGWKVERARKQREAVTWIQQVGGRVYYDYQRDDNFNPGPEWLSRHLGIDFLNDVRDVDLRGAEETDVTPLAGLTRLKELYLNRTQVSDVTPLAGLTTLEVLNLYKTRVTDVTALAALTSLEVLNLHGTQVRDVTPLAELTRLKELRLERTQVSEAAVDQLKEALPQCSINLR